MRSLFFDRKLPFLIRTVLGNVELCLPNINRSKNPNFALPVSYVQMKCHASVAEDDQMNAFASELPEMMSVFQFFMGLVKGNIMGFILPLGK